jgi:hypothetical protein
MQLGWHLNDHALEGSLDRDGYALAENFLAAADIEELLRVFRSLEPATQRGAFRASIQSSDLAYRAAVDHAIKTVFAPGVAAVLEGYRLCLGNFLVKDPRRDGAGGVPLHQDPSFVDEPRYQSLGLWVALVDTDATNGCVCVIPGSHLFNNGPRGSGTPFPYHDLGLDKKLLRPLPMKAGTALILSQKLFHASPANRGTTARIAAGALAIPRAAQLRCYWPDPAFPGKLAVYEVDDLFYTRYVYGARPEGASRAALVDYWYDRIEQHLAR